MVLGVAFLLLVSLLVSTTLTAVGSLLGDWQTGVVGLVLTTRADLVVINLLFAFIYPIFTGAVTVTVDPSSRSAVPPGIGLRATAMLSPGRR